MHTLQLPTKSYSSINAMDCHALFSKVCLEDDFEAFETLFNKYYNYLCQYVYTILSCEFQAEEVVSDVFIKLWNNRKQININSSLKAYLKISVRNQSIDYLRKRVKNKISLESIPENEYTIQVCPESDMIFNELNERIETVIGLLPPKGQHIFRLSRDEGLKYKEIAQQLNISIKTVETHMRRSLITLRRELAIFINEL